MIYGIGHRSLIKKGEHEFIIDKHISKAEYDNHRKELSQASKLNIIKNVYNLFERNGKEYLNYSSQMKEELNKKSNRNAEEICLEANRLLINYLSSLSMFIDYGEKYNKKHFGKQKLQEFGDKTHDFYDNHVSYRFMALMRNYAVHYGFPLTEVKASLINQGGIFASKKALLEFKSWKHAKNDIEKMPELISLDIHVEISMMFIKHLYDSYIYDIAPDIIKGIEHFNSLVKEVGGAPFLVTFKNVEEFRKRNISLQVLNPEEFKKALDTLQKNPSIKIKSKS